MSRMIGKGKLSNAMKEALAVCYLNETEGAWLPHPSKKTLKSLVKKNFLSVEGPWGKARVRLTPFGRNVARMILREPL